MTKKENNLLLSVLQSGKVTKEDVVAWMEVQPDIVQILKRYYYVKFSLDMLDNFTIPVIDFLKCVAYSRASE